MLKGKQLNELFLDIEYTLSILYVMSYIYRIVPNRHALPNRHPPPFLDVKQSINMYLSDAKNATK